MVSDSALGRLEHLVFVRIRNHAIFLLHWVVRTGMPLFLLFVVSFLPLHEFLLKNVVRNSISHVAIEL